MKCYDKIVKTFARVLLTIILKSMIIIESGSCRDYRLLNHYHFINESELLLNQYSNVITNDELKNSDYELVNMKIRRKRDLSGNNKHQHYLSFTAYEKPIHLILQQNPILISSNFHVLIRTENKIRKLNETFQTDCLFLHRNESTTAALHNCHGTNKFEGIVFTQNSSFEIKPLNEDLVRKLKKIKKNSSHKFDDLESVHLVRRINVPVVKAKNFSKRSATPHDNHQNPSSIPIQLMGHQYERITKQNTQLTVEVGLFFDETAYNAFAPLLNYNEKKITEMLLAYMNGVQALYHHPSLGVAVDISIVRMEIMRRQPLSLPTYNGDRNKLLDSFCDYHKRNNPPEDTDPEHWDVGLYLTGLDILSYENGVNTGSTLGLAIVRGACSAEFSCLITEFGVDNIFGRPYPSAGFNSIFILAHELGHSLGMSHDSTGNYCSKEGYIMSPTRGTQGETSWSPCSSAVARELSSWATCLEDKPQMISFQFDAWKYLGFPGQFWSTKQQCEILLKDKDAFALPLNGSSNQICQNLQCKSPHKSGFFFAGPALEGSECGLNDWCEEGYCTQKRPIQRPLPIIMGGWSSWKYEKCSSGCIAKSKGYQIRRRYCNNPTPINTHEGCEGLSYDSVLCNDVNLCRKRPRRKSADDYASMKCKEFSQLIDGLDPKGVGLQAEHENNRIWMGCTIFCKRKSNGSFYTPRFELNDLGKNAYFPDGTLCHSEEGQNYYCLQHHCLPEGFSFSKSNLWVQTEDIPLSGNALPNTARVINSKFTDYLSLDSYGKPILTRLKSNDIKIETNQQWTDDYDYRIIDGL